MGFPHDRPARDGGSKSTGCPHADRHSDLAAFYPQISLRTQNVALPLGTLAKKLIKVFLGPITTKWILGDFLLKLGGEIIGTVFNEEAITREDVLLFIVEYTSGYIAGNAVAEYIRFPANVVAGELTRSVANKLLKNEDAYV